MFAAERRKVECKKMLVLRTDTVFSLLLLDAVEKNRRKSCTTRTFYFFYFLIFYFRFLFRFMYHIRNFIPCSIMNVRTACVICSLAIINRADASVLFRICTSQPV